MDEKEKEILETQMNTAMVAIYEEADEIDLEELKRGFVFEPVKTLNEAISKAEKIIDKVEEEIEVVVDEVEVEVGKSVHSARRKAEEIKMGKSITVIYGSLSNQKVLNGKLVDIVEAGIIVTDKDGSPNHPIVIPFEHIIGLFEVKKLKKEKDPVTFFKINRKIKEFFVGSDEELRESYEKKLKVKKLKDELKSKKEVKK